MGQVDPDLGDQVDSDLFMGHFAAPEDHHDLGLHPLEHETFGPAHLHAVVVLVDIDVELELLQLGTEIVAPGFLFTLGQLVTVFAEIEHLADRRIGLGADFDQIQTMSAGRLNSLLQRLDAEAGAIGIDDKDFTRADALVDT